LIYCGHQTMYYLLLHVLNCPTIWSCFPYHIAVLQQKIMSQSLHLANELITATSPVHAPNPFIVMIVYTMTSNYYRSQCCVEYLQTPGAISHQALYIYVSISQVITLGGPLFEEAFDFKRVTSGVSWILGENTKRRAEEYYLASCSNKLMASDWLQLLDSMPHRKRSDCRSSCQCRFDLLLPSWWFPVSSGDLRIEAISAYHNYVRVRIPRKNQRNKKRKKKRKKKCPDPCIIGIPRDTRPQVHVD
jgi:hypothetical protein